MPWALRICVLSLALVAAVAACSAESADDGDREGGPGEPGQERCPAYLQESWATIHADCYNSDYGNYDPSPEHAHRAVLLEGYASIAGLSMDESRGRLYITRGASAAGDLDGAANLVAVDRETREIIWDSGALVGDDGVTLGPCAATSAPIVARNGDLFIADCEHLWAIHPDGTLRWRAPLPESPSAPYWTAFFTHGGEVGGITASGRVDVFDPETGQHLDSITLPEPPAGLGLGNRVLEAIVEECLWVDETGEGRILEESVSRIMLEGFFGRTVAVGNTPAAVPDPEREEVTRIFVPGLLDFDNDGENDTELYRIDFDAGSRRLTYVEAFEGRIQGGGGSASSPNVSADGSVVMIADNEDNLHGFDTTTGEHLWTLHVGQLLGSATTDLRTGVVWIGTTSGLLRGFQLDPDNPRKVPERVFSTDLLPLFEDQVPPLEPDLFPVAAVISGVIARTPNYVLVPATIGYRLPGLPEAVLWPMRSVLVVLDDEGRQVGPLHELHDVVEAGSGADALGQIAVPHASISSSLMHCVYRHREEFEKLLGEDLGLLPEPLPPSGGISVLY